MVLGLGLAIQGLFIWGLGFGGLGLGFGVDLGFRIWGVEVGVKGLRLV